MIWWLVGVAAAFVMWRWLRIGELGSADEADADDAETYFASEGDLFDDDGF